MGLANCILLSPLSRHFYTPVDFKENLICMFRIQFGLTQHNCLVRATLCPRIFQNPFISPLNNLPSNQEVCFVRSKLNSNAQIIQIWFRTQNPRIFKRVGKFTNKSSCHWESPVAVLRCVEYYEWDAMITCSDILCALKPKVWLFAAWIQCWPAQAASRSGWPRTRAVPSAFWVLVPSSAGWRVKPQQLTPTGTIERWATCPAPWGPLQQKVSLP